MNRVVNSIRGSNDHQGNSSLPTMLIKSEINVLKAELNGLSQMLSSLQSQYSSLRSTYSRQLQRNSPLGIISTIARHSFALYCICRILSTTFSTLRRYI